MTSDSPATGASGFGGTLDRYFHITQRGSTISREVRGGLVTFFAMAYIIALNPIILGGEDSGGGLLGTTGAIAAGTALIAGIMTIAMGVVANFPLALAAGLGINSIVAVSAATIPQATWADVMGVVVIEGLIITLLVLTGFRQAVFDAIPQSLRVAIGVGIGLFIALIGFVNAGFVKTGPGTVLTLASDGSISSWPVVVFVFGLLLTIVLSVRKVRGAILISIISTSILAVILEAIFHFGAASEDNPGGWASNVPTFAGDSYTLPDFSVLGHFSILGSFQNLGVITVILLAFSMLLADFFDTMGTMLGVAQEGGLLDDKGNPLNSQRILLVDSVAAAAGGLGGVSSNTSYVESTSGVAEGARTGLASVVTGILFLLATFLSPLVALVPAEAAAPALVIVGFLMLTQIHTIDLSDYSQGIPAFFTIVLMPFTYSITVGIGAGFIVYTVIKLATGRIKEVHPLLWGSAILFVIYFAQGPLQALLG